jgi:hypothetical protein
MMQAYTPVANENPSAKDAYKNIELLDAVLRSHEFLTKITKQSLPITAQGFYSTTAKSLLGALTRPETLNAYLDNAEDQGEKLRTLFEKTISSKLLDTDTLNAIKTTFEAVSQSRTHWQQAQENHARVMGGALDLNADPA